MYLPLRPSPFLIYNTSELCHCSDGNAMLARGSASVAENWSVIGLCDWSVIGGEGLVFWRFPQLD